ncbi:putative receptor-type tyrosine-protein phosphatase mosPTP-1 isoform X2 [Lepeophtheirus salmonis]|uniref:putative receptor-type tyrosine-protein phosphatase mosPTP-1 isoform X2 n=1 Tax=Lepeophtheirus salmonis TaxID=72036 RepID=UPI001AE6D29B|nr:12S rRNA N4-methylcytidine methyltransferase-like isoform X2 [Lepeophtheirus salmonis]
MSRSSIHTLIQRSFCFGRFLGEVCPLGRNVTHTPIFFQEVLDILKPKNNQPHARVIASDRDVNAINLALRLGQKYPSTSFNACVSRFSELPKHLIRLNLGENMIDGVILDSGISDIQWNNENKGFACKGPLDLRMDSERFPELPTGSEVLQTVRELALLRLLKNYGKLKKNSKLVANAIIESRYMFSRFFTAEELYEVILDALKFSDARQSLFLTTEEASKWESAMTDSLLEKTITALRMFINDEINQLEYGVRIASHYLKPGGLLLVIVRNEAEEIALRKSLMEIDFDPILSNDPEVLRTLPWKLVGKIPYRLSKADQMLHPRDGNARMYVASKVREMLTLAGRE